MDSDRVPLAILRADGVAAYEIMYSALSSPAVIERWLSRVESRDQVQEPIDAAASLPAPDPLLPIGVLASIATAARSGVLEWYFGMASDGTVADDVSESPANVTIATLGRRPASEPLRRWSERYQRQLDELFALGGGSMQDWPWVNWTPPVVSIGGRVPALDWGAFEGAVDRAMSTWGASQLRPSRLWMAAVVLLRDWEYDLEPLLEAAGTTVDVILAIVLEGPLLDDEIGRDGERGSAGLGMIRAANDNACAVYGLESSAWTIFAVVTGLVDVVIAVIVLPDRLKERIGDALRTSRGTGDVGASHRPSASISTDFWTIDDALGYGLYADAIVEFMQHPNTRAPLTIGIKGTWGAGKTSLMRMVRSRLDPDPEALVSLPGGGHTRRDKHLTVKEALKVGDEAAPEEQVPRDSTMPAKTARPTVWFNAWMYQSSEQVWAGLAHAIIEQMTGRLAVRDREEFWLRLNLSRVDRSEFRRRIHRLALERLVPIICAVVVLVLLALCGLAVAVALGVAETVVRWIAGASIALPIVVGSVAATVRWTKYLKEPATKVVADLVREPDYDGELGFLHHVFADVSRVLDLVAEPSAPIVVFVDDLDRCNQASVVQVIEAINLFLAGQYPNCMFVIAIEPDIVAAHLDVHYDKLVDVLKQDDDASLSFGWRFLEKMVQLPLSLPDLPPNQLDSYLDQLLSRTSQATAPLDERVVDRMREKLRSTPPDLGRVMEVARQVQQRVAPVASSRLSPEAIRAAEIEFAAAFRDDADEVKEQVRRHLRWLSANPREIKRFVNVLRFYSLIQVRLELRGLPAPTFDQVSKLAVLAVRWPHLATRLTQSIGEEDPAIARLERELWKRPNFIESEWEDVMQIARVANWKALGAARDLGPFIASNPSLGGAPHLI